MRKVTLCFLIRDGEICLAMKKRGFGEGKWNGAGGKVTETEMIEDAAVRELEEEIGVKTEKAHLELMGDIKFFFPHSPDHNQHMHVYFIKEWNGEPTESDEMLPKWHKHQDIPYEHMWVDDKYWLPKVIGGNKVEGECYFKGEGDEIDRFDLREI